MENLGKHAHRGAIPWNKGIPRTNKVKKRLSKFRKKFYKTNPHPKGMLGKKHSKETIEKIRKNSNTDKIREKQSRGWKKYCKSRRVLFVCRICSKRKLITRKRARTQKYCNYSCLGKSKRNKNQRIVEQIRGLGKYEKWRTKIFERDSFLCQKCRDRSKNKLQVHHKISLSVLVKKYQIKNVEKAIKTKKIWSKKNAITLCIDCHKETDSYLKNYKKK